MRPSALIVLALLAWPAPASPALADGPANRFPQQVRAGDLAGRDMLEPTESQPVLGRIESATRRPDGAVALRVRTASLLPWRGRVVDVPLAAVALLGEHVALLDLTPAQFAALPDAAAPMPLPPDEQLRVGLVRPFH